MEIVIDRSYYPNGTNGLILLEGKPICHSIELPWLNNRSQVSCIPEGVYPLALFDSPAHGNVLMVMNVPGRTGILFHPANSALTPKKQLKGCIAPVSELDTKLKGVGWNSRTATKILYELVAPRLENNEAVFVWIQTSNKKR